MKREVQDAHDTLLKNKEQMLLLQEENLRLTRENSLFADEVEQKVQVVDLRQIGRSIWLSKHKKLINP